MSQRVTRSTRPSSVDVSPLCKREIAESRATALQQSAITRAGIFVSRHDSCSLVPKMGEMPFRSNLEALPIGVIVTDLSGRLVGCNHQAQALLEIPTDAIGRQLRDVSMAPGVPDLASEIPQVPTAPGVRHLPETRVQRRGADAAIVRLLLTPAVDADGTPSGVIIAAEDCTRRRELEAMRHVDDYRHEFLALLAHEL